MSNVYTRWAEKTGDDVLQGILREMAGFQLRNPQTMDPTALAPLPPSLGDISLDAMSQQLTQWARACGHGWTMLALLQTWRDRVKDRHQQVATRVMLQLKSTTRGQVTILKARADVDPEVIKCLEMVRRVEGLCRVVEAAAKSYDRNYAATSRQITLAEAEMRRLER